MTNRHQIDYSSIRNHNDYEWELSMIFAVTGASGQLGRLVADQLLSAVPSRDVVLLSRHTDALASYADRGVDVRRADFDEPDSLAEAFRGVDRLLLISIDQLGPKRIEAHGRAIDAARKAGVEVVAYTSLPRTGSPNPAGVAPDHAGTEDLLRGSGLEWTFLRNNVYAELQLAAVAQAAESGQWLTNAGAGATAYVCRADCAAVAAGVLTGEGHHQQIYDVTGPQAWTAHDLAALAAERSHRPVEVVHVDDTAFAHALEQSGLPTEAARLLTSFNIATRDGYLDNVTDIVDRIGGRPATSLRDLTVIEAGA